MLANKLELAIEAAFRGHHLKARAHGRNALRSLRRIRRMRGRACVCLSLGLIL